MPKRNSPSTITGRASSRDFRITCSRAESLSSKAESAFVSRITTDPRVRLFRILLRLRAQWLYVRDANVAVRHRRASTWERQSSHYANSFCHRAATPAPRLTAVLALLLHAPPCSWRDERALQAIRSSFSCEPIFPYLQHLCKESYSASQKNGHKEKKRTVAALPSLSRGPCAPLTAKRIWLRHAFVIRHSFIRHSLLIRVIRAIRGSLLRPCQISVHSCPFVVKEFSVFFGTSPRHFRRS